MKYFAILKDSFYETIDFKLFYVLIGLSLLLAVAVGSFIFPRNTLEYALARNLPQPFAFEEARAVDKSWFAPRGRYRVVLTPSAAAGAGGEDRQELYKPLHAIRLQNLMEREARLRTLRFRLGVAKPEDLEREAKELKALPDLPPEPPPPQTDDDWAKIIGDYLTSVAGISEARVIALEREGAASPRRIEVEMNINWAELPHSHDIGFVFGVWRLPLRSEPMAEIVFRYMQDLLISWIAGWAGIIVALIVTAGFVPNMLTKGTVDFLVVKPISRPALLIYKYLGGLTFVFFNAIILVGGTWIAFGLTTGNWSPWYLTSIFVLTFYFAILYSMSVLIGVLTRSALASILITIGFWFVLWVINQTFVGIHLPMVEKELRGDAPWLYTLVDTVHLIFPKPGAVSLLNETLLLHSSGSEAFLQLQKEAISRIKWSETLLTSAAFIALMLGLACWRFSRKDY